MDNQIDFDPLPPPPPHSILHQPKLEDAFTRVTGVVLPKKAKKFKAIFRFIGRFELILGTYTCIFGSVACAVSVTQDRSVNLGIYAGICGAGLFLLTSGGLKLLKYRKPWFMITNLSMSFVSALMTMAIAGLCIWRLVVGPKDDKITILPASVAAIMLGLSLICIIHVGCYCAGRNISLDPIQAVMYSNVHTGEQFVEYEDLAQKKREKRREKSLKKEEARRDVSHVTINPHTGTRRYDDKSIPMAPIVRSNAGYIPRPSRKVNETSLQRPRNKIAETD